jgi:hypothetical protein
MMGKLLMLAGITWSARSRPPQYVRPHDARVAAVGLAALSTEWETQVEAKSGYIACGFQLCVSHKF